MGLDMVRSTGNLFSINYYDNFNLSSVSVVILDEVIQEANFTTGAHWLN